MRGLRGAGTRDAHPTPDFPVSPPPRHSSCREFHCLESSTVPLGADSEHR